MNCSVKNTVVPINKNTFLRNWLRHMPKQSGSGSGYEVAPLCITFYQEEEGQCPLVRGQTASSDFSKTLKLINGAAQPANTLPISESFYKEWTKRLGSEVPDALTLMEVERWGTQKRLGLGKKGAATNHPLGMAAL